VQRSRADRQPPLPVSDARYLWHGTRNWGDRNGQARLTEAEAFNIRSRYLTGTAVDLLATEFGVSEGHIKAIGRGEKWKHLV